MEMRGLKTTIVGGGIAGLAAANALAQRGCAVTVLEQAEELAEVGAGLQVGPNGVAVLEALGLRDAAEPLANVPEAVDLRELRSGRRVARLPMGHEAVARWGRPYWQFHRADLLSVLEQGARQKGVTIELGRKLGSVAEAGDADVIIAADGVRSAIRKECFAGVPVRFTRQVAWRGLVPTESLSHPIRNAATVYMGSKRHIVMYPLRGGSVVNFVAVEERDAWADEGWSLPDSPDNLRAAFAGATPEVARVLAAVGETFLWGLFSHPELPHWSKDNVALIGDACHPMLPFLAQGAVMALEDAWILAREMERGDNIEAGLQAYERLRKPRATRVQNGARANATAYHLAPGPVRGVAHLGLSGVSLLAPTLLAGRFDWLYGTDVTVSG